MTESEARKRFEDAAFNAYFMSTIKRREAGTGSSALTLVSTADKTQAEFCARKDDGCYADETLDSAWWGFKLGVATAGGSITVDIP